MATIILIETTQATCSAALSVDGKVEVKHITSEPMQHATKLPTYIQDIIQHCKNSNLKIDAVAVSSGPGSYTGLRIATSTAKGVCYALDAKLIAIDTLTLIAHIAHQEIVKSANNSDYDIQPMVDARRMEVYTAKFNAQLQQTSDAEPLIIDEQTFANIDKPLYLCGDGAAKCGSMIQNENIRILRGIIPTADMLNDLAVRAYNEQRFEDVAYFEPFYLKEFQFTKSNKKPLA